MEDSAASGSGRLPDFMIIGAAKSGTSTLYSYLAAHPQLFMSTPKEPCFFDADVAWERGLDWYRGLFAGARPEQLCGEASTNYTRWPQVPDVPARISELIPDCRFLYLVRDPAKRAFSHYVHRHTRELYPGEPYRMSFEEFVEHDPMCLDSSDYQSQIEQYLAHFPRESIHVLTLEALSRHPRAVLPRVLGFLGVASDVDLVAAGERAENPADGEGKMRSFVTAPLRRVPLLRSLANALPQGARDGIYRMLVSTPYARRVQDEHTAEPMREETRQALRKRFEASNRYLEREFDVDLSDWAAR